VTPEVQADKNTHDLIIAASRGLSYQVKTLLEKSKKLDVNRRDASGWTALHHSCHLCDGVATEMLLQNGADPK
jgi:ankyrin repeat protein